MLSWLGLFSIPGVALLILFILVKPQEFVSAFERIPFLHLFTALAVFGYFVDVRLRRLQPEPSNMLGWVVAFVLWAIASVALNTPNNFNRLALELLVLFAFWGVLAHGVQRLRTFHVVAGATVVTSMFVAIVCMHQGLSSTECIAGDDSGGAIDGHSDGRSCATNLDCLGPGAEPGFDYRCERVGLFGTYSVDQRVRYRGELKDPNEVALTLSAGAIALLIGFASRRRSWSMHRLMIVLSIAIAAVTVFMTKSRGGLLAMMLVPAIYFVRKHGLATLLPAALLAIPVLLLGGRSDANADLSTQMRYDAWATGIDLWHHHPLFGVGVRQFAAHHFLTAHNSFVLTLAELGIVGMTLFTAIIYLSLKTLIVGLREIANVPGARTAEIWGTALLSAMAGIVFQINTLSFAYHHVLWLFLGLIAAWYSAVRHHKPDLSIRLTLLDLFIVAAGCLLYAIVLMPLLLKLKGAA